MAVVDGGLVYGVIYSRRICLFFPDGDRSIPYYSSPASWQYVGYVDIGGTRHIRTASDRNRLMVRLKRISDRPRRRSVSISGIHLFELRLSVAEMLG
jgi:hypothetical protein